MTQTRLGSFIEACVGTVLGFAVALVSQLILFPLFGIHVPLSTNLLIGFYFTLISVARGYLVRRFANAAIHRFSGRLAGMFR